ncbi:MAG: hypothetical protein J5I65_02190 [Aridibacter famidurans]|nr:hypothetical protein [Aridibacter famidurans]
MTPLSRWQTVVNDPLVSPAEFLSAVADELRALDLDGIRFSRVRCREGSIISDRRNYLRVRYKALCFDVFAFAVGLDLVCGFWLMKEGPTLRDLLLEIPLFGQVLKALRPVTIIDIEKSHYFQNSVFSAVSGVASDLDPGSALLWEQDGGG